MTDQENIEEIKKENDEALLNYICELEDEYEDLFADDSDSDTDDLLNYIYNENEEFLAHYGVGADDNPPGRGSGRYEKGSGENPFQHERSLSRTVRDMKKQGLTESEIALALGVVNDRFPDKPSVSKLRALIAIEKNDRERDLSKSIPEYKKSGMSNVAIAKHLGISEATVRNYLNADRKLNYNKATNVANVLKEELKTKHYIDVGPGVELEVGLSRERMKTALEMLKAEGYKIHHVRQEQLGNPGKFTTITVIGEPDTEWKTVARDPSLIKPLQSYFIDNGESARGLLPVNSIDSKRVFIRYTEGDKGGVERDGIIELRRGVEDISLGNTIYSQVRIGVDGDKYMKGMAHYSDNIPKGYDIVYNTNKSKDIAPEDVFKKMERDQKTHEINKDNPFGASIKEFRAGGQSYCLDKDGNPTDKLRVINKVTDQGDWGEWSKTISPQVLSKQPRSLVQRQLSLSIKDKELEFEEIKALTNPTIKKKLLESYADDCDASAAHLKAKAFPGQTTKVILPVPSLPGGTEEYRKQHGIDGEIYAPTYENGTLLAAVRFPHAGPFESPVLRVNNNNKEARSIMGNAPDAVGFNNKVASKLSGADFDGDTVVLIPLTNTNFKTLPRLKGLEDFDPKSYKFTDPNAPKMTNATKQREMGLTTNLIADMQIKGATPEEVVRAVKHSMVVIDAEKHHLDYKKSELDNGIADLKLRYQGSRNGGASTLITRAKSPARADKMKAGRIVDEETGETYYAIDPRTGKKILEKSGETYKKYTPGKNGEAGTVKTVIRQEKVHKMDLVEDARDLMSSKSNPYPVEVVYAEYANRLKALANEARKEAVNTPRLKRDPQAAKKYAPQVQRLDAALAIALKNAPRERQAQIAAGVEYKKILKDNPEIKDDKSQVKRLRGQLIDSARRKMGAQKQRIAISDIEWEAIQNGAISDNKLRKILDNTDADALRKRATPRDNKRVNLAQESLAKSMASRGYTIAEIAERLGVSSSTVSKIIN